jgi:hypothetical protein
MNAPERRAGSAAPKEVDWKEQLQRGSGNLGLGEDIDALAGLEQRLEA